MLQKTLDYACGAGADCGPIHQNGPCFNPNTVKSHCSYAVNSFFQKKGQSQGTCDFAGTAIVSASDPSESLLPISLHLFIRISAKTICSHLVTWLGKVKSNGWNLKRWRWVKYLILSKMEPNLKAN